MVAIGALTPSLPVGPRTVGPRHLDHAIESRAVASGSVLLVPPDSRPEGERWLQLEH